MPGNLGRVGQHARGVVGDLQRAADIFDDKAVAGGVMDRHVDRNGHLESSLRRTVHLDLRQAILDLLDRCKLGQDIGHDFIGRDGIGSIRRSDILKFRNAREEEQACGKAFFIDAIKDERQAKPVGTRGTIFGRVGQPRACGSVRTNGLGGQVARNDNQLRLKLQGKFQRPPIDDIAVLCLQDERGAGRSCNRRKGRGTSQRGNAECAAVFP